MKNEISKTNMVVDGFLEILLTSCKTLNKLSEVHDWDEDSYWYEDVINNIWLGVVGRTLCPQAKLFPLFCPLNELKKEDTFSSYACCVVASIKNSKSNLECIDNRQYFLYSFVVDKVDCNTTNVIAKLYYPGEQALLEIPASALSFDIRDCLLKKII